MKRREEKTKKTSEENQKEMKNPEKHEQEHVRENYRMEDEIIKPLRTAAKHSSLKFFNRPLPSLTR